MERAVNNKEGTIMYHNHAKGLTSSNCISRVSGGITVCALEADFAKWST
ncbi:hypothetical protein [Flavobacterium sp. UBA7682]|nr:hypothetical protein [Flavobacterium sp. UBA7682]